MAAEEKAELVACGKVCGFHSENSDPSVKGFNKEVT